MLRWVCGGKYGAREREAAGYSVLATMYFWVGGQDGTGFSFTVQRGECCERGDEDA